MKHLIVSDSRVRGKPPFAYGREIILFFVCHLSHTIRFHGLVPNLLFMSLLGSQLIVH
jgi:hypothetical protein